MRKPCSGKVNTWVTGGGKYKYYRVTTFLDGKFRDMCFPHTQSGLRKAKKALKEYQKMKNQEVETRQKDTARGLRVTKRFRDGGLKNIWVTFNTRHEAAYVIVHFVEDGKVVSGRSRVVHKEGFKKTVDLQLDRLCKFYKFDRRTSDIKSRIETTRRLLKKRYKELCKEHGFRPSW